jgi:hypothetical protein
MSPTRSSVTRTAMLRSLRPAARTFVREKRYGRADRMSSTGVAGASSEGRTVVARRSPSCVPLELTRVDRSFQTDARQSRAP